jgi:hypothetical protein
MCLARALVFAKAKLENYRRDRHIRDPKRPLQTCLARDLHQKAGVPVATCGIKRSQTFSNVFSGLSN